MGQKSARIYVFLLFSQVPFISFALNSIGC